MALTKPQLREILSTAGVTSENMDAAVTKIMDGHLTSIDALREERDKYKADAEKLPTVQKELEDLKAKPGDGFKQMYEEEHAEHEKLKAKIAKDASDQEKSKLFREILEEIKVNPKRIDAIMKVTNLDELKVKDGKLEGRDKLVENAKSDWADFVVNDGSKGANPDNPPGNNPSTFEKMPLAEKMKYANEHPTDAAVQNWLNK